MTFSNIYVGATANDGTGNPLRDAMIKVNYNFSLINDNFMAIGATLSIAQVEGLQTILNDIQAELNYIPGIQSDIVSINNTITNINNTLNNQNLSIIEIQNDLISLQSDLVDLQTLINTKIGEAPIDGNSYVRRDEEWVLENNNTYFDFGLPKDFYVGSTIGDVPVDITSEANFLTYKTDTYRKYYMEGAPATITNSNEVLRDGNDLYIFCNGYTVGGGGTAIPGLPVMIAKLQNCNIVENVLVPETVSYQSYPTMYRIHGSIFHRGFIYASSRGEFTGVVPKIYKINPYNLSDVKEMSLTGFAYPFTTGDIKAFKNYLYVLMSDSGNTSSFVRINTDLSSFTTMFTLGTTSAKRVSRSSAFQIYNGEVYIPTRPNTAPGAYTLMGIAVYDLYTGALNREVTNTTVATNVANTILNPHWMGVFNDKLIVSLNTRKRMLRFDCRTLAFEEGLDIPTQGSDDNTIFSNGDIYLNGEWGSAATNSKLLKIPYNNFAAYTEEISLYNFGNGSAGSINITYDIDTVQSSTTENLQATLLAGNTASNIGIILSGGSIVSTLTASNIRFVDATSGTSATLEPNSVSLTTGDFTFDANGQNIRLRDASKNNSMRVFQNTAQPINTTPIVYLPSGAGTLARLEDSLLQESLFDSYSGTRLIPTNSAVNGFGINKNINGNIGLTIKNTNTAGNSAIASIALLGDGPDYFTNGYSFIKYGANYYIPYLQNKGGIYSTGEFTFLNVNSDIVFRTGPDIATMTQKLIIGNTGSITIGVTPSTNNSLMTVLSRDTNGEIKTRDISNLVPYTGATTDVQLGTHGLTASSLGFTGLTNSGQMTWNDQDGTIDLKMKGGNVTLQIGQEQLVRVVNKTATNITLSEANYQAVRVTGAQGLRLKVDLAQATTDTLSAETIGLVTETILNNQEGFITTSGLVRGINTTGSLQSETWVDGDILYLSPTVPGQITKVKPIAPNHLIVIGYVINAHITQGSIFVKVNNGYEIDELHNVKITGPTNSQVLIYQDGLWINGTASGGGSSNGLIKVTEGGKTGYRLADEDASNHIEIGVGATDLSISTEVSTTNGAGGSYSFAAGRNNESSGYSSVVGGGEYNYATSSYTTISGGNNNYATSQYSTIAGGNYNQVSSPSPFSGYGFIGGGNNNFVQHNYASIVGGNYNFATAQYTFVGGGNYNQATASYATIAGGSTNEAGAQYASVLGGYNNRVRGQYASILGGYQNDAFDDYSLVGGGNYNKVYNQYSSILGGNFNSIYGKFASIVGGNSNRVFATFSSIINGSNNTTYGYGEVVGGIFATEDNTQNPSTFVLTDRIFTIGNGIDSDNRSDALRIYKNGLGLLPSVTNAIIASASGKAIITKEYFESNLPAIPTFKQIQRIAFLKI